MGELRHDLDARCTPYRACMNMGTLSGAPKVRAMRLIADAEGQRRGIMAARSVYFTATAIWTPVLLSAPRWWKQYRHRTGGRRNCTGLGSAV